MVDKIQIPATLEGISTLKDGSLSLRFHTQELSNTDKVTAMEFVQEFGWLLFAAQPHSEDEQLEQIRKDVGGKTPSQRLRAVLYIKYVQSKSQKSFESYYAHQMEQIIDQVKSRLDQ